MVYDEALAHRVREVLGPRSGLTEKKMFGGLSFLLDGKMFCGIVKDDLMVRVGPERHQEALALPNVRPMEFTGRSMAGYVFVGPAATTTEAAVAPWVEWGAEIVAKLPASAPRKSKPRAKPPRK